MTKIMKIENVGIGKYDNIVKHIDEELDEFQQYKFIMLLFNNLLSFLGSCFDSDESEQQFYKLLKAYNIMMEILKENDGVIENQKNDIIEDEERQTRTCSECKKEMAKGYCIENGLEYYCSDECLHKHYTQEEFEEMYDDGNGDSYYTEWEE